VETGAVKEIVGCVKERKTADEGVGEAFALQSGPGPGGVDLLEMIAAVELMREFEVMEDSKDGLCNFHEGWLLSGAMLADV
jgi:hypothetical protein